jgi:uncharacterized protein YdeI (YjbR/CyaY-like superfamily)
MAKTVDYYLKQKERWTPELTKLREILLSTSLEESVKWGMPSYSAYGQNIVGLGAFANHFCLWFHQGALLADKENVLMNAQEGKTKAMRQWRMTRAQDIKPALLKRYLKEAMKLAEAGEAIKPARGTPVAVPAPLKTALAQNKAAAAAFKSLTPGKRREYADYVKDAKRDDTKLRRIEKIVSGVGLNDKYKC